MNFTNRNSIFWRTLRLQLESTNQSIDEYPTFIHVRSVFNDEWYNFIIPIQEEQYFEWDKAEEIREAIGIVSIARAFQQLITRSHVPLEIRRTVGGEQRLQTRAGCLRVDAILTGRGGTDKRLLQELNTDAFRASNHCQ